MIRVAKGYIQQKNMGEVVKLKNGPVEDRALLSRLGKFDFVYSTFSLHHWSDPVAGIKNLHDALNPGGTLFIYDFFRGGLFYYLKIKKGIWESIRASYTPDELRQMVDGLGIDSYNVDVKYPYIAFTIQK